MGITEPTTQPPGRDIEVGPDSISVIGRDGAVYAADRNPAVDALLAERDRQAALFAGERHMLEVALAGHRATQGQLAATRAGLSAAQQAVDLAEWLASLADDPGTEDPAADVPTLDQIITRAREALGRKG